MGKSSASTGPLLDQYLSLLDGERSVRRARGARALKEYKETIAERKALLGKMSAEDRKTAESQNWRAHPAEYDAKDAWFDANNVPLSERPPKYFWDIDQLPHAGYEVDISWDHLEDSLARYIDRYGLDLEPEFQRAHVWTLKQQTAYIEYQLRGGEVGRNLTFNHPNWSHGPMNGRMEIVDGKQRLEAVRAFLRDEVPVFGRTRSQWAGRLDIIRHGFRFRVVELQTRAELLKLYLNINAGGTPHTPEELDRVRKMLAAEQSSSR